VTAIGGIEEFNIGHSIISKAVLVGLDRAVRDMADLIKYA
jgi:pyridoxine 5-phosphate synthase